VLAERVAEAQSLGARASERLVDAPHQLDQEQAIAVRELDATAHPPLQHNQLMSECRVLCLKSALA
jgi:hypothetical protein